MKQRWTVVMPFRGGAGSKSRLAGTLPASVDARRLAAAMAYDVMTAALGSFPVDSVVVLSRTLRRSMLPARFLHDPRVDVVLEDIGSTDPAGDTLSDDLLNTALRTWLAGADAGLVAILLPDLASLRAASLDRALLAAESSLRDVAAVFVPDVENTGTVMLAGRLGGAGSPRELTPSFGRDSALRHARSASRLELDDDRLRRDVDTAADLVAARALGLGPYTTEVLDACDSSAAAC